MSSLGRSFDAVADLYDDVRPLYPDGIYAAVEAVAGPLAQARVLDLAAGTGIASRALSDRGAVVTALDPGRPMLEQLRDRSPSLPAVVARAERLPFCDDAFSLVTCATAWHWVETAVVLDEIRRVVGPGGHLALWWANHRFGDGIDWETAQSLVYDRWETERGSRPADISGVGPREAAEDLRLRGLDVVVDRDFRWERRRSWADHIRVLATHSDVIALGDRKAEFLAEVSAALQPWPVVDERLWGPLVVARFSL